MQNIFYATTVTGLYNSMVENCWSREKTEL